MNLRISAFILVLSVFLSAIPWEKALWTAVALADEIESKNESYPQLGINFSFEQQEESENADFSPCSSDCLCLCPGHELVYIKVGDKIQVPQPVHSSLLKMYGFSLNRIHSKNVSKVFFRPPIRPVIS